MKTLLLILLTTGTLLACGKKTSPAPGFVNVNSNNIGAQPAPTTTDTLSYLALGDSYTIGEGMDQKDSFPYQLSARLAKKGLQNPVIIAQTGWTTNNLITAIGSGSGKKYDMVTLLIGVNDQFQGLSQTSYRANFIQLLKTAIGFAKNNAKRVFVISIPDYGVTPFANGEESRIGPEVDLFNNISREESSRAGVNYINITGISKQAADNYNLLANDGLHPSAAMYQMWVELIGKAVERELKN